jgi:hypothetical protein
MYLKELMSCYNVIVLDVMTELERKRHTASTSTRREFAPNGVFLGVICSSTAFVSTWNIPYS